MKTNNENKKDSWDKAAIIFQFLTPILIAVATYLITSGYQRKQQKIDNDLKRIDLLEKLMPYLSSRDSIQNKVAIEVLSGLGYDSMAVYMGRLINSPGTREALRAISKKKYIHKNRIDSIPANALLNTDGTPLLNTDGSYLMNETGTPILTENGDTIMIN